MIGVRGTVALCALFEWAVYFGMPPYPWVKPLALANLLVLLLAVVVSVATVAVWKENSGG